MCEKYKKWSFVFWIYSLISAIYTRQWYRHRYHHLHCKYFLFYQFFWLYIKSIISFSNLYFFSHVKTTWKCIFDVICHVISSIFSTAETMHCNNESWHWGNLVHIYAVFQYNLIVENIISGIYRTGGTIHCNNHCHLHHCWQVITTCKFFSVDFQLLPTCLQHRVVPCVLNPAHRVLSMRVNHLHKVLSEKDIQSFSLLTDR